MISCVLSCVSRCVTNRTNCLKEAINQPRTRPISEEQLIAEVKGIYARLTMIEGNCINDDRFRIEDDSLANLNNEQWQALIALHRTLLYEHHDFFLASQHPSANPESMMEPLYDNIPAFEDTWIECLEDLARYRYVQTSPACLCSFMTPELGSSSHITIIIDSYSDTNIRKHGD